jgi:hypothetical protein
LGWKRVLPKVRYLVVQCHAVQLPLMSFGIVPKAVIAYGMKFGKSGPVALIRNWRLSSSQFKNTDSETS